MRVQSGGSAVIPSITIGSDGVNGAREERRARTQRRMDPRKHPTGSDEEDRIELVSRVIEYEDCTECTLFPRSTDSAAERRSTWMTARDGAFVDRQEMR